MKVFLNPGHAPNGQPDPGACGCGLRESDVAAEIVELAAAYLEAAGVETEVLQSDSLSEIANTANASGADIFVSVHCNAFNGAAHGTETCVYSLGSEAAALGECIQDQIVDALGTTDRGLKERPGLYVLSQTDMPAVLVETAFIDNAHDAALLRDQQDEFARAIARGVTDYERL
jgi:N-acetylmuramoyl-L-alanine amidase